MQSAERLYLVAHIMRLTGKSPAGPEVTVAKFSNALQDLPSLNPEQWKLLQEVFDVRVEEQRFEEDEIGTQWMLWC